MKRNIGYRGHSLRPTAGIPHYWLDYCYLLRVDVGASLLRAAESGDTRRINRFTRLAAIANGRAVYTVDGDVSVCWQGDDNANRWIAPNMSLSCLRDENLALAQSILKITCNNTTNVSPQVLCDALGARRIEALRDGSDFAYVGGSIGYVEVPAMELSDAKYATFAAPKPQAETVGAS